MVLAKTNLPQTMMFFECVNPLWGRTLNPHSAGFSCGGSSGGEAAMLAMDGCALGWGSDIGGSLRYCHPRRPAEVLTRCPGSRHRIAASMASNRAG